MTTAAMATMTTWPSAGMPGFGLVMPVHLADVEMDVRRAADQD